MGEVIIFYGHHMHTRLERPGDRQCCDFQTHRLAGMVPGPESELDRALAALKQISVIGLVERFDEALAALEAELATDHPGFSWDSVRANTTSARDEDDSDTSLNSLLITENSGDLKLLDPAMAMAMISVR